uniref:Uncharacterized protein n=1 Tax=Glossina austeni TaxID=7395 RepID=A0A1A9UL80_GLOAU
MYMWTVPFQIVRKPNMTVFYCVGFAMVSLKAHPKCAGFSCREVDHATNTKKGLRWACRSCPLSAISMGEYSPSIAPVSSVGDGVSSTLFTIHLLAENSMYTINAAVGTEGYAKV